MKLPSLLQGGREVIEFTVVNAVIVLYSVWWCGDTGVGRWRKSMAAYVGLSYKLAFEP